MVDHVGLLNAQSFRELELTVSSKQHEGAASHNQSVRERNEERRLANRWTVFGEPLISSARRRTHVPEAAGYSALAQEVSQRRGKAVVKIPDLVIQRGAFSAAVEVALNWKGKTRMEEILQAYRFTTFDKIFYVMPDAEDRANLTALLKHPNWVELRKRFVVLPLLVPSRNGGLEIYRGDSTFLYRQ